MNLPTLYLLIGNKTFFKTAQKISNIHRRDKFGLFCANNKEADQPVHPRSLISAFVIHFLQSTAVKSR